MPIIEVVRGQGEGAPRRLMARLGWFGLIWLASTAAFIGAAGLLHLLIPR